MPRKIYEDFRCDCGTRCVMLPHWTTGVLAPIEVIPNAKGNVVIESDMLDQRCYRIIGKHESRDDMVLYLNHYATCKSPRFVR